MLPVYYILRVYIHVPSILNWSIESVSYYCASIEGIATLTAEVLRVRPV